MAVGYTATEVASILPSTYLDIQPSGSTEEWVIHNIIVPLGCTCELYKTDGTYYILDGTLSCSIKRVQFHCTNAIYYTIKNVGATAVTVSYDGIITRS